MSEATASYKREAKLEAAIRAIMVGGNHLVGLIGADHPSYRASYAEALRHYGQDRQGEYDAWCCWRSIMQAREFLGEKDAPAQPPQRRENSAC
jgi:hypothetical protein